MTGPIESRVGMVLWRNHKRVNEEPGSHLDRMIGCLLVVKAILRNEGEPPGVAVQISNVFNNGVDMPYVIGAGAGIHHSLLTAEFFEVVIP